MIENQSDETATSIVDNVDRPGLQTPESTLLETKEEKCSDALDIDEAFETISGFGKLQFRANLILACGWNASSIWWSNIYTLFLAPEYLCLYENNNQFIRCDEDAICAKRGTNELVDFHIDWTQPQSLHNWYEKFDLLCQQDFIKWALFSFYALQPLVLLRLPSLTDRYGRKIPVQVGAVISTVLYTIMIFNSNKYILMAVMALQGAMIPLQFNIAYVYLIELMPRKYQTTVSTI